MQDQAIAQGVEVIRCFRVVIVSRVGVNFAHNALAQPPLLQRRKAGLRHVAEIGQPLGQDARDDKQ